MHCYSRAARYDGVRLQPENTTVRFLRETIRSRPGEIVLLSIGPFSNLVIDLD